VTLFATTLSGADLGPAVDAASVLSQAMQRPASDDVIVSQKFSYLPRMFISWHDQDGVGGFLLHCFEADDFEGFFLAESLAFGPCEVRMALPGGATEAWPRQLFVPWGLALDALSAFLVSDGERFATYAWVPTQQIPRQSL
jgi:hypothetical protein